MSDKKFSWVETHKEITEYLRTKQNKQLELIQLLKSIGVTPFNDKSENKEGVHDIELGEIDPFTFYCYIYKYGEKRRLQYLQKIAKEINVKIPTDEKGIPSAQAQKVWLFPYKYDRINNEISRLWDFFHKALADKITDADFSDVLKIRGIGKTKLTEALFYIQPEKYLPINGPTIPYIEKELNLSSNFNSYQEYISLLNKISAKAKTPFYELSYYAWEWNQSNDINDSIKIKGKLMNMKEKFIAFLNKNNKKGSQKTSSYIRALELLDDILNAKAKSNLEGFKSIYDIESVKTIKKLHQFVLKEQKTENGIFENEEPISYWRDRFYSAAIKSYLDFLNQNYDNESYLVNTDDIQTKTAQIKFNSESFQKSCEDSGLKYKPKLITRYISSLATKPFVLLSGLSGSGKTKLAQAFAQWISEDETQYCIVPVGADWTNREPLLGYVNALNDEEYILPENGALKLLIEANKDENQNKPYFLILDEMNLSHVERYFSDFLSVMESKDNFKLHDDNENDKSGVQSELPWPKNLFVVGTVNIDETTYMFSPKVLDRANVIEFRVQEDEIETYLAEAKTITSIDGFGATMGESFVDLAIDEVKKENLEHLNAELVSFFKELQPLGAEFGYRTASEIQILFSKIDLVNPSYSVKENEKIDIAIMQKLLPKLHGSRRKLLKTLNLLANKCLVKEQETIFNERGVYTIEEENLIK